MRSILFPIVLAITSAVCGTGLANPPSTAAGSGTSEATPAAQVEPIHGKILERIDTSGYSYLRLSTGSGETWAAVPQTSVPVGTEVTIANPQSMDGFESKSLQRKFEQLVFGTLAGVPPAGQAPLSAPAAGSMSSTPAPAAASTPLEVPRAEGPNGKTVAELWAQKDALKDSTVWVRGKVVKANLGILDRNWLHLRDGTGSDAALDNDVTITTQDGAAVGDVVLIKGTVRLEKDFGHGYKYALIVEEATVSK